MGGRTISGFSLHEVLPRILRTSSTVSPWEDVLNPGKEIILNQKETYRLELRRRSSVVANEIHEYLPSILANIIELSSS